MIELNKIYNEPCLETISRMKDESIDCVITSPPYWQLRDYGYNGQWGLEPTFEEYLENLWSMMDALWSKLKHTGTAWINLGDTYGTTSGNIQQGNLATNKIQYTGSITGYKKPENLHKCLLLLPHRFAIGCIERGWIIRNDIVWAKRNGMPEAVTDRFSKKHEYFFLMSKSQKYYFDLESIKDKTNSFDFRVRDRDTTKLNNTPGRTKMGGLKTNSYETKNPGSVADFWDIPTKASSKDHFAMYNDNLLKKPIIAGCPKGGVVYDPFIGSGTTALMAIRTGRNFIGSEMSTKYASDAIRNTQSIMAQTTLF